MKTCKNTWLLGLVAFLFTVQFCWGQEYKLEHKFTKGEVTRYKRTVNTQILDESLPGGKREIVMEYYLTRKVDNVYPDGTADVILTQDSVITRVNLERIPNPKEEALNGVPIFMKESKTGAYTEIRALKELPPEVKTDFENMQQNLLNQPGLPAKALNISESWDDETTVLQNIPCCGKDYDHTITLKSTSMLMGLENHTNVECAKVQSSGTMAGAAQTCCFTYISSGKFQRTTLFDHNLGREIKATANMDMLMKKTNPEGTTEYKVTTVVTEELLK